MLSRVTVVPLPEALPRSGGPRIEGGARAAPLPRPIPAGLLLAGIAVAGFAATPLVYIALRAFGAAGTIWIRVARTELLSILGNTLVLTALVTGGAAILGTALAILVERTDLPGRRVWRWILAVPLAIPPFIAAVVYVGLLRPVGGALPRAAPGLPFPSPFGLGGSAAILILVTYPYIYLLAAAALRSLPAAYEEAARAAGKATGQVVTQVWLPFLRPAVGAGALLVAFDCLAEYGAVAFLRYPTFSAAIFRELSGRYDRSAASILSLFLVILAFTLAGVEARFGSRGRSHLTGAAWKPARRLALGGSRYPALVFTSLCLMLGAGVPVATLVSWWAGDPESAPALTRMATSTVQSLGSAGAAAVLAVALSLPIGYLASRFPSRRTYLLAQIGQLGYALPGVVVALSLLLAVNQLAPFLYGSPFVVALAYLLRYFPQAVRGARAALGRVPPGMEEAARGLGRRPLPAFLEVVMPTILPGLAASASLVFLSSLKELPATLLLRPAGFNTLAVEVWQNANEGFYSVAAAPGLLLIAASMAALAFLLRSPGQGRPAPGEGG
ncbi:MAG: ABC transporter permease [Anaerolineales bacterium]